MTSDKLPLQRHFSSFVASPKNKKEELISQLGHFRGMGLLSLLLFQSFMNMSKQLKIPLDQYIMNPHGVLGSITDNGIGTVLKNIRANIK